jgi:tetratricopeptide (TPR) repeat protein
MRRTRCAATLLAVVGLTLGVACGAATLLPQPMRDDEVVQVLPAITRHRPAAGTSAVAAAPDPAAAVALAREAIGVARQTGDARYWGRAQAAIAPWWDQRDAPVELAVLQSTVQQGRHAFAPARAVLQAALARTPGHAQGWLNLAALERVEGRYAASLAACEAVARAGQDWYAQACRLETASLQGQHAQARAGLQALLAPLSGRADASRRGWLLSLLAEAEERAGNDAAARARYTQSLAAEPDLYTQIAFGDLLLRTGQPDAAQRLLAPLPRTDAVLLRQAIALRRLQDPRWQALRDELRERATALDRRGEDLALHDRERALLALWLDDAPARALTLARRNLDLQREPLDWWIALQAAREAGDTAATAAVRKSLQATGLQDARLAEGRAS